jgi:peptide/nickel transport system substrate-binding protein
MLRKCAFRSVLLLALSLPALAQGELHFVITNEPKTFNPVMVDDEGSETIRYLTGGVLIRFDRKTQKLEPELASSWKVTSGKIITFKLRDNIKFSDGTPFTADDVAYTIKALMDPAVHSTTGDAFRSANGVPTAAITGKSQVTVTFPAPVAGVDRLFDTVAIMSAKSPLKEKAVLGPFMVSEYKSGSYVLLKRNPNYWKKDEKGRQLPYLDGVKLDIQQNRETELLRFQRGELHLINTLPPDNFERLAKSAPRAARDLGPSLDAEQFWFNQVQRAPIAKYKLDWFRSTNFRRAVASAINRDDIVRLAYSGHATPGVAQVSPANHFWFNSKLKPIPFNLRTALDLLAKDGFKREGPVLKDKAGNVVEFSIVTNAGNKTRERIATMIQQDLVALGIKVNVVTLDFPSLIERMTQSFDYEACMLGLLNSDFDPNAQMNVWLSSAENHQWNPGQKSPETAWESEIDKLMRAQAASLDNNKRKQMYDRVQEIVLEQVPFLYLVNKDALAAIAPSVKGADPVAIRPQTFWNAERLSITGSNP